MKLNSAGIALMHKWEGCKLSAYRCPANIVTIGYGNTYYADKSPVRMGDTITQKQADELFLIIANEFSIVVRGLLSKQLSENQFSALVSFTYNVGVSNLKKSTLLRKVNINPSDPSIPSEFLKWNKAAGKVLSGLTKRRMEESELYAKL